MMRAPHAVHGLGLLLLAGCGQGDRPATWLVTADSVGSIRFGMTPRQAATALGLDSAPAFPDSSCDYWTPQGAPPGVSFMVENGAIVRVDVDSPGVKSAGGLAVGSPAGTVRSALAGQLLDQPHKYEWEAGWRYLSAFSADSTHAMVFEVDSFAVRNYRAGLLPAVGYVERCS
jgi:hypothetical protein